jgi:acyl-CoA synthetase (AMP-forming)/AMP-acid ligase II
MTLAAAPRLIGDLVTARAIAAPDDEALRYGDRTWTWAQLADRVRRVSGGLAAAGIGPGDVVAVLDKNHPACLELTLGAAALGAANAVLNWRLAADEVAYVVADCGARILFVGEEFRPVSDAVRKRLPGLERVLVVGGEPDEYEDWLAGSAPSGPTADVDPASTALVLYTSGTTGFPKGALLSHHALLTHTAAVRELYPDVPGGKNLVAMPLFHVGGSCYALVGFLAGVPTVLLREVTAPGLFGAVAAGATHAFLVPAVLAQLVQAGPDALAAMSGLRWLCYGASPCPLPVLRAVLAAWPDTQVLQVYGMTELSGVVCYLPDAAHRDPEHPERLVSAGVPLPEIALRVVDPVTGQDVAAGDLGELWWLSQQRMSGYLGKPEATAATIVDDGWLRSGDLGRVDEGGFVFVVDRVKDMIISGGENVYAGEVERVLAEHPSVLEVAVIGVPDPIWGESVLALVRPAPGHTVDHDALIAFCRERLAGYKCPRRVELIDELPRNPTGKVLKTQLRRPYWEGTGRSI